MTVDTPTKLNSLLNILRLLDGEQKATPELLAETLEVTERSVYRYISALQGAGYPIYYDRQKASYRFIDGYRLKRHVQNRELSDAIDLKCKMFGSSTVGLVSYDDSGQCIVANEAAAIITGGTRKDLLSHNYHHIESWKYSGLLLMAENVMSTGLESGGDFHLVTTFGREAWFHFCMSRFEQSGKNHLLVTFQDISEKKLMEERLKMMEEELIGMRKANAALEERIERLLKGKEISD